MTQERDICEMADEILGMDNKGFADKIKADIQKGSMNIMRSQTEIDYGDGVAVPAIISKPETAVNPANLVSSNVTFESVRNNELVSGGNVASGDRIASQEMRITETNEKLESVTGASELMGSASKKSVKGGSSAF